MREELTPATYEALLAGARSDNVQSTVVGIAVHRGDRVLLLQRKADDFMPGLWEMPGGHIEAGESIPNALARELLEETGWTLGEVVGLIDAFDYEGEAGQLTREWNFDVIASSNGAVHHPEHQAHAWVGIEDLAHYPMSDDMRRTVATALGSASDV